jgi:hypothetical protein
LTHLLAPMPFLWFQGLLGSRTIYEIVTNNNKCLSCRLQTYHVLHEVLNNLSSRSRLWQWDVESLLKPPPRGLVQVLGTISGAHHQNALFTDSVGSILRHRQVIGYFFLSGCEQD